MFVTGIESKVFMLILLIKLFSREQLHEDRIINNSLNVQILNFFWNEDLGRGNISLIVLERLQNEEDNNFESDGSTF